MSSVKKIIGINTVVTLENGQKIPAKVDTGADSTAIWASNISLNEKTGELKYTLFDKESEFFNGKVYKTKNFSAVSVTSAHGTVQKRYKVKIKMKFAGKTIAVNASLADRSKNTYPILIGRKTLQGKFTVDLTRSEVDFEDGKFVFEHEDEYDGPNGKIEIDTSKIKPLKIAILSNGNGNYSTKRLKRAAENRGHKVDIIKYKNCFVSIDRKDPKVIYRGDEIDIKDYDAIIPRIANSMTKYGTAIVRQLEREGIFTTSSSVAIARSRDKLRSAQIMSRFVDMPKTVFSRNSTDIDSIIEEVGGVPVVIKLARGTHGNGVVLADSKKMAKSALQAFYLSDDDGTNILVQEFIKEAAGSDIRAFVVNGRVVASMERKSLDDDFRSNLHKGGSAEAVKLSPEERRVAIKAAKAMGLAVAGVDLMRSERGPLVLEVNASPGFGIEKYTNRDVATPIIEYIEQNVRKGQKKDKIGV